MIKPALSFTPLDYTMVIKSRAGLSVFTTKDHLEAWDGRMGDKILPEDVYIWFIEAVTPGGKTIRKNGTVTIIFNRNS